MPFKLPTPLTIIPSSNSSISAPNFVNSLAVIDKRSLSLFLASEASLIIVFPLAKHAAKAIIGISSINLGIISPPISTPTSSLDSTTISPTSSPATIVEFFIVILPVSYTHLTLPTKA